MLRRSEAGDGGVGVQEGSSEGIDVEQRPEGHEEETQCHGEVYSKWREWQAQRP